MNASGMLKAGATVLAGALLFQAPAQAEPRHEFRHEDRERDRPRYATPHWVYDNRYHHDHYYPAFGYRVTVLPPGHIVVRFRGGDF